MQNFESQKKTFPPGTLAKGRFSTSASDYAAYGAYEWPCYLHFMLPYLEQQGYYDAMHGPKFDLQNPWDDPTTWSQLAVQGTSLSAFLCPSDYLGGNGVDLGSPARVPKSNYLGIFSGLRDGDNYSGRMYTNPIPTRRATFRPYEGTPIADITDGTSNTMAVAEYLKGVDENDYRGTFWSNRAGLQFLYVTFGPNSLTADNISYYFCPSSGSPRTIRHEPAVRGSGRRRRCQLRQPASRHSGGVNAVFCDGSVHFIQDSIDATVWQSLGWIADGNAPGSY